jgi:hypothetical protein
MEALKTRTWRIEACSAKTKHGLEDGFKWVVDTVKK